VIAIDFLQPIGAQRARRFWADGRLLFTGPIVEEEPVMRAESADPVSSFARNRLACAVLSVLEVCVERG
jgi:hypothetical protein